MYRTNCRDIGLQPKRAIKNALIFGCCLLLTGCLSTGNRFSNFKSDILERLSITPDNNQLDFVNAGTDPLLPRTSANIQTIDTHHWWARINDPLLNIYIERLLSQNLNLIQASERTLQARSQLKRTNANFIPSVGATASASRNFSQNQTTNTRVYNNTYSLEPSISWQIDLFGKIRSQSKSSYANFQASIYERDALAHTLIADLLNQRISVTVEKEYNRLAKEIKSNRQQYVTLQERRYNMGSTDTLLSNVYDAKRSLDSAASNLHDSEISLAQSIYALDTILGDPPGTNTPMQQDFPIASTPLQAQSCLPASLLDRRPDLRAEHARLKSSHADVNVAIADLYPDLSLSATLGFSGNSSGSLLSSENLIGSIASTLSNSLYEGGALRATIKQRESALREQEAAYAQVILTALEEAENSLKATSELSQKRITAEIQMDTVLKTEDITAQRYNNGIASLKDLLDAQLTALQQKQALLLTQQEQWSAYINLYLALGGDWLGQESYASCQAHSHLPSTQEN